MPGHVTDDLGPGVSRRNIRGRNGRESIDQEIEPAVIHCFEVDDVLINEHLRLDHREARPA